MGAEEFTPGIEGPQVPQQGQPENTAPVTQTPDSAQTDMRVQYEKRQKEIADAVAQFKIDHGDFPKQDPTEVSKLAEANRKSAAEAIKPTIYAADALGPVAPGKVPAGNDPVQAIDVASLQREAAAHAQTVASQSAAPEQPLRGMAWIKNKINGLRGNG